MSQKENKYWTGLEELDQTSEFISRQANEFPPAETVDEFLQKEEINTAATGRRDFLKFMGFSLGAATLAACETPITKVIPYVNKPENITPGIANYYSSTYYDGNNFANVLIKCREGRPIHIKGNSHFNPDNGAINARINASVLDLYNEARLRGPVHKGEASSWEEVDAGIIKKLGEINAGGGNIVWLTNSLISPSTELAMKKLEEKYSGASVSYVAYDSISYSALREAHLNTFGTSIIPTYDFSKAKTIVSIACDFMGSWIMGPRNARQYSYHRNPGAEWMSRHFQFESNLSLSGSNADERIQIKPSQESLIAVSIYNHIASITGNTKLGVDTSSVDDLTRQASRELYIAKGASIVVAGSNNIGIQTVVCGINNLLKNYGSTLLSKNPLNIYQGDDRKVNALLEDLKNGKVDAVLMSGVNPAYNHSRNSEWQDALKNAKLSVSFSLYADEMASHCEYICPDNHSLESWNDFQLDKETYTLAQPVISPLFDTRQIQVSCLTWAGADADYYALLKNNWMDTIFSMQSKYSDPLEFWNYSLHNGVAELNETEETGNGNTPDAVSMLAAINNALNSFPGIQAGEGEFELSLYTKMGLGDGSQAANPWLQELPDPITKVSWDNYITMSPVDVRNLGFQMYLGEQSPATLAKISVNEKEMELPVVPVPGQTPGTIGIALGYGRGENHENIGKAVYQTGQYGGHLTDADGFPIPIGKNAFTLAPDQNGFRSYSLGNVKLEGVQDGSGFKTYPIAATQTHHTLMERDSIVRETIYSVYKKDKDLERGMASYNKMHTLPVHEDVNGDGEIDAADQTSIRNVDLWNQFPVENIGHRWGMSIDLSTCIGCSACITACHSENNVPVVGKDEVRRSRDMHWLRIDRYFSSDNHREDGYKAMRIPSDSPKVVHMPMMCQHCNHAPCETVCPVAATTHSNEGLNQMTYNRCIGTRYCANNCPYKVRRFNWFNYKAYKKFTEINPSQDSLARMVLNPDVTVRARGVMEKCSMCVQRIQAGKLKARMESTPVQDGAIATACAEACPTHAITFGDLNDKASDVWSDASNVRSYNAIEEVGTRPNVYYMALIRNNEEPQV